MAKLHHGFAPWLLPGSGIINALALTAACRDLRTDISQPLVNTLLSQGSICSPFLCPLAPIMKPRTPELNYCLSLTFSSLLFPAWIRTQSLLQRRRPEWRKEEGAAIYQSVSAALKYDAPEQAATQSKLAKILEGVIGVGMSTRLKSRAAKFTLFLCK